MRMSTETYKQTICTIFRPVSKLDDLYRIFGIFGREKSELKFRSDTLPKYMIFSFYFLIKY